MANMACRAAVLMYVLQHGMQLDVLLIACAYLCYRCFDVTMRSRMCAGPDVCVVQSEAYDGRGGV